MIDISDGLSTDLGRICEASNAGATIIMAKIPCPAIPAVVSKLRNMKELNIDSLALQGGDNYELLFTVPPQLESRLPKAPGWGKIRRIGTIQKGRSVLLVNRDGKTEKLESCGWDSFQK